MLKSSKLNRIDILLYSKLMKIHFFQSHQSNSNKNERLDFETHHFEKQKPPTVLK